MHIFNMSTSMQGLKNDPLKTVVDAEYTNSIPKSVTNGQTDRRTDRQGQILMPSDYRHGGIK